MPTFITAAHQKGGVGKTTLSLNLYAHFTQAGLKVAIVDTDPQGSTTALLELYGIEGYRLLRRKDFSDYEDLKRQVADCDVVLIDTPPYHTRELREILKLTNFLILPCKPSLLDALAIRQTINLVKQEREKHGKFLCGIVLTMLIPGSTIHVETREYLKRHELYIFNTEIYNRVSFLKALLIEGSVLDEDGSKAKEEIQAFANEMLDLIAKS